MRRATNEHVIATKCRNTKITRNTHTSIICTLPKLRGPMHSLLATIRQLPCRANGGHNQNNVTMKHSVECVPFKVNS